MSLLSIGNMNIPVTKQKQWKMFPTLVSTNQISMFPNISISQISVFLKVSTNQINVFLKVSTKQISVFLKVSTRSALCSYSPVYSSRKRNISSRFQSQGQPCLLNSSKFLITTFITFLLFTLKCLGRKMVMHRDEHRQIKIKFLQQPCQKRSFLTRCKRNAGKLTAQ